MTNWTELADAFRAAIGPDRELDARLALACGWRLVPHNNVRRKIATWFPPGSNKARPNPTFSDTLQIGETIRLFGEVLPEAEMRMGVNKLNSTVVIVPLATAFIVKRAGREHLALALCEAICRAKAEVG